MRRGCSSSSKRPSPRTSSPDWGDVTLGPHHLREAVTFVGGVCGVGPDRSCVRPLLARRGQYEPRDQIPLSRIRRRSQLGAVVRYMPICESGRFPQLLSGTVQTDHRPSFIKHTDGRYEVRCPQCERNSAQTLSPLPIGIGVRITNRFEAEAIFRNHGGQVGISRRDETLGADDTGFV